METFTEYLETIRDEKQRAILKEVLSWVNSKFPSLEAKIAWNQPMFIEHGTFIIGFSASKQHFAISPEVKGMERFSDAIKKSGYSHGKNIFRISWEEPIDFSLLEEIIRFNMQDKADYTAFWRK